MGKKMSFWQQLYQQSQAVDLEHMSVEPMQLNHKLNVSAYIDTNKASWLPSPAKGVKRLVLEREGGEQTIRATSIVAYGANSQFSPHAHPKGEEFFVLAGTFSDEYADYPAGSYVRNPPGSSHQPFSREGCLIWVKLQQFAEHDQEYVNIDIQQKPIDFNSEQLCRKVLFDGYENVEWLEAKQSTLLPKRWLEKGAEILLLSGVFSDGRQDYRQGSWLRFPPGSTEQLKAQQGTQLLLKYGHLR